MIHDTYEKSLRSCLCCLFVLSLIVIECEKNSFICKESLMQFELMRDSKDCVCNKLDLGDSEKIKTKAKTESKANEALWVSTIVVVYSVIAFCCFMYQIIHRLEWDNSNNDMSNNDNQKTLINMNYITKGVTNPRASSNKSSNNPKIQSTNKI